MTQAQQTFRHRDTTLTGIKDLRGALKGQSVIICCSGPSLAEYRDEWAPSDWPRIAVNEAIRKVGDRARFWVLSDVPILQEYAHLCPRSVEVLAMHDATQQAHRFLRGHKYHTVESMNKVSQYGNGYEFFSRGTVMIGAIEMARYMGASRFFIFGLDCYCTRDAYYYDGRLPLPLSEKVTTEQFRVRHEMPPEVRIYVTPRLRRMIDKLNETVNSKLWNGVEIHCVNSPWSQQNSIPKLSLSEFLALLERERQEAEARSARRRRVREEDAPLPEVDSGEGGGV